MLRTRRPQRHARAGQPRHRRRGYSRCCPHRCGRLQRVDQRGRPLRRLRDDGPVRPAVGKRHLRCARPRLAGSTLYASRRDGPAGAAIAGAARPLPSLDGRRVAFTTTVAADPADTGTDNDVYVRDLGVGGDHLRLAQLRRHRGERLQQQPTARRHGAPRGLHQRRDQPAPRRRRVFQRRVPTRHRGRHHRAGVARGTGDVPNTNTANSPDISADGT